MDHPKRSEDGDWMSRAFNEWMRRYTDEPERFEAEFRTCSEFLTQTANGEEPSYGARCAAYLRQIGRDIETAKAE